MGSLDARLRGLTHYDARPNELAEGVEIGAEVDGSGLPSQVEVLVQCTDWGSVTEIKRVGMSVRAIAPGPHIVVSGVAPVNVLNRLASVPGVERVEASRQMLPELDISRADVGALRVHSSYLPLRGAGVLVGIIDEGIDYTHPDFRHADGSSRILCLWDQNAPSAISGGVPYGRAYTKFELDVALSGWVPPQHGDPGGHGTHVRRKWTFSIT